MEEGGVVDEYRHLRPLPATAVGGVLAGEVVDDRVGLQLIPGPLVVVLIDGAGGGDGGVERRPHLGVIERIECQQRLAHPGVLVDPATHVALPPQPFMTRQPAVTGKVAGEVADLAVELLGGHRRGGIDQRLSALGECFLAVIVEMAGGLNDRIDVPGTDHPLSERLADPRHRRTHGAALGSRLSITAGAAPATGEHHPRRLPTPRRGQLGGPPSNPPVDRVEPTAHPQRTTHQPGQPLPVAVVRVGQQQLDNGIQDRPAIDVIPHHQRPHRTHVPHRREGV